jgi:hypothetical protein
MPDQGWNDTGTVIVVVASLGVALSVVGIGMGFVNIMSADAGARLSAFSVARGKQAANARTNPAAQTAVKFVDIDYIREEIAARQDEAALLRQAIDLQGKELAIEKELQERLALAQNPDAAAAGAAPAEPQAVANEIARLEARITELRARQEAAGRVDVARWLPVRDSAKKILWVECVKDGVVLQPEAARFTVAELQPGSSPFGATLNSSRPVLLVRPSGFDSCAAVRAVLDARGIEYDLAPVDENWQLIFR